MPESTEVADPAGVVQQPIASGMFFPARAAILNCDQLYFHRLCFWLSSINWKRGYGAIQSQYSTDANDHSGCWAEPLPPAGESAVQILFDP